MADIESRKDIEVLMQEFYQTLLKDHSISYIFTDIARINLEEHLPVICDFWESILLQSKVYRKDILEIHINLNEKEKLTKEHFDRWLHHFYTTVDKHFIGLKADLIKMRAQSIATVMQTKLHA